MSVGGVLEDAFDNVTALVGLLLLDDAAVKVALTSVLGEGGHGVVYDATLTIPPASLGKQLERPATLLPTDSLGKRRDRPATHPTEKPIAVAAKRIVCNTPRDIRDAFAEIFLLWQAGEIKDPQLAPVDQAHVHARMVDRSKTHPGVIHQYGVRITKACLGTRTVLDAAGFVTAVAELKKQQGQAWLTGVWFIDMIMEKADALLADTDEHRKHDSNKNAEITRSVVMQMAEGLGNIHRNGVIHNDFTVWNVVVFTHDATGKPIALAENGAVKIIDFGISHTNTDTTAHPNTYVYRHPDATVVDYRIDMYAFGIVVWQLLTVRRDASAKKSYTQQAYVLDPSEWGAVAAKTETAPYDYSRTIYEQAPLFYSRQEFLVFIASLDKELVAAPGNADTSELAVALYTKLYPRAKPPAPEFIEIEHGLFRVLLSIVVRCCMEGCTCGDVILALENGTVVPRPADAPLPHYALPKPLPPPPVDPRLFNPNTFAGRLALGAHTLGALLHANPEDLSNIPHGPAGKMASASD